MIKDNLKIVIKEFHDSDLPPMIERKDLFDLSIIDSPINKVITIIGPRRAGKTYYFFQIIKKLLDKKIRLTEIVYINFEDERILPMEAIDLKYILDAYFELYGQEESPFIFLDEIQNITGWERFVRRLNDKGIQVFITGSNSRLLGREIATSLRGRTLMYEIFPFSFREFLFAKGIKPEKNTLFGESRHSIRAHYESYIFSGGYPEVALSDDEQVKGRIVQDYFNTVFYKDLVDRYRIKSSMLLKQFMNSLIMNPSSMISFSKIENDFRSRGMKLSRATLSAFARYIEDVFFGFFVPLHSESIRKRQANPKKFYLIDVGMHNYLTLKFSENKGRILENMVFLELMRKRLTPFYHKTSKGHEVDFIFKEKNNWNMIQVCHDLNDIDTFSREKKTLISGLKEIGLNKGTIITDHEKREEKTGDYTLDIVPIVQWLLQ